MRWWHVKVKGHPSRYELEVAAYVDTHAPKGWGIAGAWFNPRSLEKLHFTNEFLGEPVPLLDIKVHTTPIRPVSHPPPPREAIEFLPTRVFMDGVEQDPE